MASLGLDETLSPNMQASKQAKPKRERKRISAVKKLRMLATLFHSYWSAAVLMVAIVAFLYGKENITQFNASFLAT